MGKSSPKPPPAPDPVRTAQAQTESNIATATAQQRLNMVGSSDQRGSVSWVADPSQPGGYRQVTSLNPSEQQSYDLSKQAENAAYGTATQQIGRVNEALGRGFSYDGLPALRDAPQSGPIRTGFDPGSPLQGSLERTSYQGSFDPGQQVQGQVGPADFSADRRRVEDAMYGRAASRLDPTWDRREQQLETRLANQGLSMNSDAYRTASADFNRDRNDAYGQALNDAIMAGGAEQSRLFGMDVQRGQFANQAAGQQFTQNMTRAAFGNDAADRQFGQGLTATQFGNDVSQQQYGRNMDAASFANQAEGQRFGQELSGATFGNQARSQGAQERAYEQNLPLNQFGALMSLGQVGTPQGIQYTPSQVGQTDVLGAYAMRQQADQARYQAQVQNRNAMLGGLFQLGGAAILASDRRLKTDVVKIGARPDGLGVYRYRYLWSDKPTSGVMADEVAALYPHAVHDIGSGFLGVNYGAI